MNLASPRAGLDASASTSSLNRIRSPLTASCVDADGASERLCEPFGVVRELDVDPGALGAERLVA